MNKYYILSPDELHDLVVVGDSVMEAIANSEDLNVYSFFQEYKLLDCYVEQLNENE